MTNQTKIRMKKEELNTMLIPSYKNVTRQNRWPARQEYSKWDKISEAGVAEPVILVIQ